MCKTYIGITFQPLQNALQKYFFVAVCLRMKIIFTFVHMAQQQRNLLMGLTE